MRTGLRRMRPRWAHASLSAPDRELRRIAHHTLAKVEDDIGRRRVFNTAVAAVMELLNAIGHHTGKEPAARAVRQEALEIAVLCLSPIVPHVTPCAVAGAGAIRALWRSRWRKADPAALVQDLVEVVVQVNGKLRGRISVPPGAPDEAIARGRAGRGGGAQAPGRPRTEEGDRHARQAC